MDLEELIETRLGKSLMKLDCYPEAYDAHFRRLRDELGPIDVLIDDGGHEAEQQITTFETLYPRLSPRGIYVCEDVHSSYLPSFGEGREGRTHPGSFMEYAKALLDRMHAWFSAGAEPDEFTVTTGSIHVYTSLVVIERRPRTEPTTVARVGGREVRVPISQIGGLWTSRS